MRINTIRLFFILFFPIGFLLQPAAGQIKSLDYFIDQGLAHSPLLKDIRNQVNSTVFDSLLIKAGKKPQVSFNGLLYYAPVINGIGYSDVITNISNISSQAIVTQRIFNQKTTHAL